MAQGQPKFLEPFMWAVLRVATYVENSTTRPRLLFGSVSLLATDRPRPKSLPGVNQIRVAKGKHGKVFVRRTVLTAMDAIEWYRSAPSSDLLTPVPSAPQEAEAKLDGQAIIGSDFLDDPAWPVLGVPTGTDLFSSFGGPGDPAPFVGSGATPARIHRRFGQNAGFDDVIKDPDVVRFLTRRLHINLADYTEYLGSIVLIVPNPVLRGISHFIVPATENGPEKLVFRLLSRPGQFVKGLRLTAFERRANLLSRFETIDVPDDGLIELPQLLPVQASGYVVTHPDHGVLVQQPPLSFFRSFKMNMEVVGRKVKVQAPKTESPRSIGADYIVSEVSQGQPLQADPEPSSLNLGRVFEAEARRERRTQARRYEQIWFDHGDRDAAIKFIRSRIGRARIYVLVADPYFGARQLIQFLHAVTRIDVQLAILTSRLAFDSDHAEDNTQSISEIMVDSEAPDLTPARPKVPAEQRRLTEFSQSLATFKERGIENASVFVLPERTPPLHDRFLVIDDVVWFLGNSLNALGDRASLILQVPDSEPILSRLEEMRKNAVAFDEYLERRRQMSSRRKRGH